ncbi:MAG: NADH-ubiquinone oxidoreductase subunit E family protein [Helicobacteraceae bacterium]|jgi:NADH-quinone oxidoreductase subunit E|nr:NADH-ubiquinone oxidoreductase subunit E family protein [Helicobacteraceae bacterium]
MKRFDLRRAENVMERLQRIIIDDVDQGEAAIFIYEVAENFALVQESADLIKKLDFELINSLKYNEVDWTICVRKPIRR